MAPFDELDFRPLAADDLALVHEWLGREHVRRWWGEPGGYEETVERYLPAIEGREPTDIYAILLGGQPVGMIQTTLVADHPEYAALVGVGENVAGVDLFIGEGSLTGRGLGTGAISRFVALVVSGRAATRACVSDPDVANAGSIRAFEKAGFARVREFYDPGDGRPHALMWRDLRQRRR